MAHHVVVGKEDDGVRLDVFLIKHLSVTSRKKAKNAVVSGKVFVDGVVCFGPHVQQGQRVEIRWSQAGTARKHVLAKAALKEANVEIIYQDKQIVVANKPAGLLTDTATRSQFRQRDSLRKQLRARVGVNVIPAHRIDRDTSGVVAFAKDEATFEALRSQWKGENPKRVYWAAVWGSVKEQEGVWEHAMRWDAHRRVQEACDIDDPQAVLARCRFKVIRRSKRYTWLELQLITGRRNQLRLQAWLEGHALVGERQYTDAPAKKGRQALHARLLELTQPVSKKKLVFQAPAPADLAAYFKK